MSITAPLASSIDHTLLRPTATATDIEELCSEAHALGCFSVCVHGSWVPLAKELLRGSSVKVCSVIGFPLGAMSSASKVAETEDALAAGADEIDMVINLGRVKSGDWDGVTEDIAAVQRAVAKKKGALLKVIIETALLTDPEKSAACAAACAAGAAFVKTCTGFSGGAATVDDVLLMKAAVQGRASIKASGGIKDRQSAEKLLAAGATRLGTSSAKAILGSGEASAGY